MIKTLVFDIETIPDIESGRKLYDLSGDDISDDDVVRALEQMQYQKNGTTFLPHYLQKIVAISILFTQRDEIKITTLSGDEKDIVKKFFNGIDQSVPRLVSWNGSGFDLPVLNYRAMLYGIDAHRYWDTGEDDRDFRFNNYINRYHWRHIDLMDILAGYNPRASAPLDKIAKMIGLPGKQIMDGSGVWDAYREGKVQEICDYCEIDVLNTYLVFLRFEKMRGVLTAKTYDDRIKGLQEFIRSSDKQHLNEYADAWDVES